jgi:dimeric dUTPase (all-alpha-NTP-PPase superfamily)
MGCRRGIRYGDKINFKRFLTAFFAVGDFVSLCAKKEAKEFMLHHLIEIGQKRKLRSFEASKTFLRKKSPIANLSTVDSVHRCVGPD